MEMGCLSIAHNTCNSITLFLHNNKKKLNNKMAVSGSQFYSRSYIAVAVKNELPSASTVEPLQHHSSRPLRIFISTGDVMGDIHGANLTAHFLKQAELDHNRVEVYALGGHRMKAAGAVLIGDNSGLSSIGFIEALRLVFPSLCLLTAVWSFLRKHPPDIVVLMDYGGVNIPFGKYVKQHFGCKIIYYIPPNEWRWKKVQNNTIVRMSDLILSNYPREALYYKQAGANVIFVGHPLIDKYNHLSQEEARSNLGVKVDELVIALIPASREQELRHVWPLIASAAKYISHVSKTDRRFKRFFVPVVLPKHKKAYIDTLEKHGLSKDVQLFFGESSVIMAAADIAITKSGSINVELALYNVPQVVLYRIDGISNWIGRRFFQYPPELISLVNVILGYKLVPEFIQDEAKPEKIAEAAMKLLPLTGIDNLERKRMLDGYEELRKLLGKPGVSTRAAKYILQALYNSKEEVP